jgi:hypothetical protein
MRQPNKEEALAFMYDALVHSSIDLACEWEGWKIRGRDLVTPDRDRISVGRLKWLIAREAMREASGRRLVTKSDTVIQFPLSKAVGE